jgi:hypothetical protein
MRGRRLRGTVAALTVGALALALLGPALADQLVREGFEGTEPLWVQGASDGTFRELAHRMTDERPFRGHGCEFIQLSLEKGNFVYYTYDTGRAPVTDELRASVWVRANRPGTQLLARVVLPHEPNPERLEEAMTALVRGDTYGQAGRWQRLDLANPPKLLRDQQQLLRVQLKHDVNIADAYVDRLVLNVAAGPGDNQVWIDNLEIGPVTDTAPFKTTGRVTTPKEKSPAALTPRGGPAVVELKREALSVRGQPLFFTAIRYTDLPAEALDAFKEAGFNTLCLDAGAKPEIIKQAAAKGFLVVPTLPLVGGNDEAAAQAVAGAINRFSSYDDVLFWDVGGGGLAREQAQAAARVVSLIRNTDPQRPIAADVWDGFQEYRAQNIKMFSIHRFPLGTGLELGQYRDWLTQRRNLAESNTFPWTWVQTHLPDWYTALVYDRPGAGPAFNEPIGPQPEQIRLLTWIAVGSGSRGLGFWSDRFLADSHTGQDRLLTLALLNKELKMIEPLLLTSQSPEWIETSQGPVKAAVFRPMPDVGRAVLILPVCLDSGSQFVPTQGAYNDLSITLPLPQYMQVWQVSPGIVRPADEVKRVPGGMKITLREFDLSGAIVCTSDVNVLVRLQTMERDTSRLAAQWSHDLAQAELKKVRRVGEMLDQAGHPLRDGPGLLARTEKSLTRAEDLWEAHKYGEAYLAAQRALRPLRIYQRASWEDAIKDMTPQGVLVARGAAPPDPLQSTPGTPPKIVSKQSTIVTNAVASPYAVSFYTLPRHWEFMAQVRAAKPGQNMLPGGDFEAPAGDWPPAWLEQKVTLPSDRVELSAERVAVEPQEGKQCLRLQIKPLDPMQPAAALERTFLAVHTPAVRLAPGSLVRISGWFRVPAGIAASTDGALVYDSAGGEPLAVRIGEATEKWKQFTLYRKVPATGTVNVTMALTGIGIVYFDDIRIEPLETTAVARP